jgi:diguanylate cyclase (GGDEF)-like protein
MRPVCVWVNTPTWKGNLPMTTERYADVLSCPSLPSLPAIAAKLIELTGDPDVQISEIAKTVQQDQALAGKVLKTVNSSFYGLPNKCGSIERAMGFLGLNTVKSLVLGFSLVETTSNVDHDGFDMVGHWRRTLMGATASRKLAEKFNLSDKDEVFTAALFQDMGMLAIFTARLDEYIEPIKDADHGKICAIETEEFGFNHAEVGSALARKWQLPSSIADAIEYHHSPDSASVEDLEMVRAVALGTHVAEALSVDSPKSSMKRIERQIASWFPKQKFDIAELFQEVNDSAKELASLFNTEIGDLKDVNNLMARAQERGLEHQISMQRQTESLEREAVTDGLTGIPNRKEFDKVIEDSYNAYQSTGAGFAVLFFDADKFKSVNDTHGHAVGDAVLIELAKRTTETVGSEGTVCRYGGEEFGVILPGYNVLNAAMLAERVRSEIAGQAFDIRELDDGPDELPVTVSIGVSAIDAGPTDRVTKSDQLVVEADAGVYAAKAAGRNNVQVWSPQTESSKTDEPSAPLDLKVPEGCESKKRVVIVEDDSLAATLLITLLKRQADVDVQWFKNGRAAIEFFKESVGNNEHPCDVVVCDFNMPEYSGFDVFDQFKSLGLREIIPFYLLTANESTDIKSKASEMGVTELIGKSNFAKNFGKWVGFITSDLKQAA